MVISNTKADLDKGRSQQKPSQVPRNESPESEVRAESKEYTPPSEASDAKAPGVVDVEITSAKDSEETESVAESLPSVKERDLSDFEPHSKETEVVKDLDMSERISARDRPLSETDRPFSGTDRQDSHRDRESTTTDEEIEENAKTAEDVSLSGGSEARTLSRTSERSSHGGEQKSMASDVSEALTVSEASHLSRATASSPEERPRAALNSGSYSDSFENEGTTKNEKSVAGDAKEESTKSEAAEEIQSESEKESSEVPEEITGEDVSEPLSEVQTAEEGKSDAESVPAYSLEFDPSAADEVEEVEILSIPSDNELAPAYTLDFEPSEAKEREKSEVSKLSVRKEVSDLYTLDFEPSGVEEDKKSEPSEGSLFSEKEKEKTGEEKKEEKGEMAQDAPVAVPRVEIEEPTDEESIAEDLPFSEEERASVVTRDLDEQERSLTDNVSTTVQKPAEPLPDERAERLTDQLATFLLNEAIGCITDMYEYRRQPPDALNKESETARAPDEPRSRTDDHRDGFAEYRKDIGSWAKAEEGEATAEIERRSRTHSPESDGEILETEGISLHLSDEEESVSGLDFRAKAGKEDAGMQPGTIEVTDESVKEKQIPSDRGEFVVSRLTGELLKEAASQMISIMRKKREKARTAAAEESKNRPVGGEEVRSPSHISPPPLARFLPVHSRFSDTMPRHSPEGPSPPRGSPTNRDSPPLDGHELVNRLSMLEKLHSELEHVLRHEDEDDDDEFTVNENKVLELPRGDDDDEFGRPRRDSVVYVMRQNVAEVNALVTSALSVYFDQKSAGLPLVNVTPPPDLLCSEATNEDGEARSERVFKRLVFDVTGEVLRELLAQEVPSHRPSWMKPKRRRRARFHHGLHPLLDEGDFLPIVRQRVLDLVGLGEMKPSLESVQRKTPIKAGKKDFVDAILIQELREEEPQWIDYDDDELAVKCQVADAIFESLLSETVMVLNTVQDRKNARKDMFNG